MSVLHELLAVEGDLDGAHKKTIEQTKVMFAKQANLFIGQHRKLEMFVEDGISYPEEHKQIDTTVQKCLDDMNGVETRYFNAMLQKESTNQVAKADLVVDGTTIASDLPATFLLGMETRLKNLRGVYESIPTLQPGIEWEKDESQGKNIYKTKRPDEKIKTKTIIEPVVLYEATDRHPAQVKESSKVVNEGKYITTTWSGMITPAEKEIKLAKIDKLIRAMKKARQRANTTEIVNRSIGAEIFAFIDSE